MFSVFSWQLSFVPPAKRLQHALGAAFRLRHAEHSGAGGAPHGAAPRIELGEVLAVLTVLLAMFLLVWEMLHLFHIFPLKLK